MMDLFFLPFLPKTKTNINTQIPKDPENPTYEDLFELWEEMTILPDQFSLRMLNYNDGIHALARASSKGLGPGDQIDLVLTESMTTKQMYLHLSNMWLSALREDED